MKRLVYSFGISVALVMLLGSFHYAGADALGMFGASSRSAAMGGAVVGIAEGPESLYYNPSALGLSPNASSFQVTNLDARLYINGVDYGPGGMVGTVGFNYRMLRDRIGLGLMIPQMSLAGGKESPQAAGKGIHLTALGEAPSYGWPMYGSPTIPLLFGFSVRLHDTLSVALSSSYVGHSYVRFSPVALSLDALLESVLGLSLGGPDITGMNYNLEIGVSWEPAEPSYSVTFRPLKYVSFGYMHQGKADMKVYIPVIIKTQLLEYDLIIISVSEFMEEPPVDRIGMGVHIPLPRSELTLAYSQDAWLYGDLYEDKYDEWERYSRNIRFSGGDQSISWPKPSPRDNVYVERYGFEYLLSLKGWMPDFLSKRNPRAAVRGGYFQWESPYPDNILWGGDFDLDADVYSGGLGFNFDRKSKSQVQDPSKARWMSIDFHFQYFEMEERDYKKFYNEWGSPIGPTQEFYYFVQGEIINYGVQLTWWH